MHTLLLLAVVSLLSTHKLSAQKDCNENIYQVAETGWISLTVPLHENANSKYTIRFIASPKGLTATISSTTALDRINKGDFWLFVTGKGEKRAFALLNETYQNTIEGTTYFTNTIALNLEGVRWLADNKVDAFAAMNNSLSNSLIRSVKVTKPAAKQLNNIVTCFYQAIDKKNVPTIEIPAVDESTLAKASLESTATNEKNIFFERIPLEKKDNLTRYSGVDQPNYAKSLTKLAELYQSTNNPEKAEAYYLEAQQHIVQFSGVDYNDYPDLLNNLANFYHQLGEYKKAKDHYLEAKDLMEKVFGNHHPQYPITLNNLGALHLSSNDLRDSEDYHQQAKDLLEEEFSTSHPEYTATLGHLANFYRVKKDYKQALELLTSLSKNLIQQLYSYYPSLNEAERLQFLKKLNQTVHQFYSSAVQLLPEMPALANEIANINLAIKGLALEGSISTRASLLTAKDSVLRNQYYNWLGVRRQLAQAAVMPKLEREMLGIALEDLDSRALALEKELSAASGALSNQFKLRRNQLTVDSIRQCLREGDVAVDFVHFNYHNGKKWQDSTLYYAVVIQKNQPTVALVYLGEHQELQDIININITKQSQSYINSTLTNKELYALIWQPLEQYLKNTKRVYVSPSGLLHQIAFSALKNKEGAYLLDQYELVQYGSFRDLVYPIATQNENRDVLLVGGAKFSIDSARLVELVQKMKDSTQAVTPYDLYAYANTALPLSRALASNFSRGDFFFSYLAGTKKEVETIDGLLKKNNWITYKYTGEDALEDKIKTYSRQQAPYIMHIATHGYFFRPLTPSVEGSKEFYKQIIYAQNPLMRSGLILTGANRVWKGKRPIEGLDDGILTAYEISNLDLFQTDLVVLSSCETGLGDVYDSEGIFGLQRALKSAGVRKLLVTLWRIPDKETALLMGSFYKHYLMTNSAEKALRLAQKEMSKEYSPFYWAGFVLIE